MALPPPSPEQLPDGGADAAYTSPESLRGPVVAGIKWKLISQILREGTRLGIGILLARLLTPEEWGVAAIALVLATFLTFLADVGLPIALVQRARITEADRSTMFWSALGLGVLFTTIGIALSGLVADLFGEPELQHLFAALSVGFTILALEKVPGSLLARELAFRALELRQIAATMAGAVVALTLALWGAGAWAIIGNSLATTTVSCVLVWVVTPWRPRLVFAWTSFRSLTGFGGTVLASQLLTYAQMNADKLLLGRYVGAAGVGVYSFAYQLMFTPILNVTYPLQMVLFPVFATIQDEVERLNALWLRTKRLSVALMAPAFLLLLVVAPDLLPALFGSKWDDSVPILQVLCLAGVAYSLTTQNGILLIARGRVGVFFWLTAFATVTVVVSVVIGLHWGTLGVATAFAVAHTALALPYTWVTARAASIGFWTTLRATCSPLPFAAAATAVAYGVRLGLLEVETPAALRIVGAAAVLLSVYAGFAYVGSEPLRNEGREAVVRLRRRRSVAAVAPPSTTGG